MADASAPDGCSRTSAETLFLFLDAMLGPILGEMRGRAVRGDCAKHLSGISADSIILDPVSFVFDLQSHPHKTNAEISTLAAEKLYFPEAR